MSVFRFVCKNKVCLFIFSVYDLPAVFDTHKCLQVGLSDFSGMIILKLILNWKISRYHSSLRESPCSHMFLSYVYKHSSIHLHDPHTGQRRTVRHTAKSASSGEKLHLFSLGYKLNINTTIPFHSRTQAAPLMNSLGLEWLLRHRSASLCFISY